MSDKNLIIFDIDGTITDSVAVDFRCFEYALELVFPLQASDIAWNTFKNMTDSSLIKDVVRMKLSRDPTADEISRFQTFFFEELRNHSTQMFPSPGAQTMLSALRDANNCELAFATGCWKKSAIIKLSTANIVLDDFAHATSDDHAVRTEIVAKAIARVVERSGGGEFGTVTYVGDGLWDQLSASELGINFVGVDLHGSGVLEAAGATKVLSNFENIFTVEDLIF